LAAAYANLHAGAFDAALRMPADGSEAKMVTG
jgi:hypothetical protein